MAVLLMILKILGILLLGLLGLVILALVLPVGVDASWQQGGAPCLRLRVWMFHYTILPAKPGKAKKPRPARRKKPKPEPAAQKPQEPKPAPGGEAQPATAEKPAEAQQAPAPRPDRKTRLIEWAKKDTLEKVRRLLANLSPAVRRILKGLHIRHVTVVWTVTGKDAADTAVSYGAQMAACNNLWERLREVMDLRADELRLEPDFTGERAGERRLACQITTQLYIMVTAGLLLLFRIWRDPLLRPPL